MSFLDTVLRARTYLEGQGRVSLSALKLEFDLEDARLESLIEELVEVQQVAVRDGRTLAWVGGAPPAPTAEHERAPSDYTPQHLADKILRSKSALEGERKQVTVLFADVKGSMELAEQLDPEEWRGILERFFEILTEGVHRFEGTVNQYLGDGIMALFGAPLAHEDHAQRACYAALHLRDELRRYADELRVSRGLNLSVRMGLNSGEVIVGKIGDDLRMDYTAQGHAVGLAQRMEQIAESGQAFLTEHTASLVEGFFELRDLGASPVRGSREPVGVFALEGLGRLRTRLDVSQARGFSKFVGRADEMAVLEATFERAQDGSGQVVGVVADAGTGKSRLCFEFVERIRAQGFPVYEAHALAHGKQIPLRRTKACRNQQVRSDERDSDRVAREKIAGRLLLLDPELREELPLVFDMMGVSDPEDALESLDPEAHQARIFRAIQRIVRADPSPGVMLIEDLHWIDAASDAIVGQIIEANAATASLVLVNFRPEYRADWMQRSDYQQLPLVPLRAEAIREMLGELLGDDASVLPLPALIHEKTGGNPFFIEEIVQSLVETGVLSGSRGGYRLARPIEELTVPGTVQAVLSARIDRLGEREKQVLQMASVIGKKVPLPVLSRVAELPDRDLAAALSTLKETQFLYEASLYPEVEYAFKHPLTEAVAYGSQLRERRARGHAAVARVVEELERERLDPSAALLAHHWAEAGEPVIAAHWHRRAAGWIGLSDPAEALHHWRAVRTLVADQGDEAAARLAAEACYETLNLGWRLGLAEEEMESALSQCRDASARLGEPVHLVRAFYGYLTCVNFQGAPLEALERGEEARSIALGTGADDAEIEALIPLQDAHLMLGNMHEVEPLCDRVIELSGEDPSRVSSAGTSVFLECLAKRGYARGELGRLVEARADVDRALALAEQRGIREEIVVALLFKGGVHILIGPSPEGVSNARRFVRLAEETGSPVWVQFAQSWTGPIHSLHGSWSEAIGALRRSLEIARERRIGVSMEPITQAGLADAYRGAGRLDEARAAAELAVVTAQRLGARGYVECMAQVALARVLIAEGGAERDRIEAALARAEELVEETGARGRLPHIHEARAELARGRGDEASADGELRSAHRLFSEIGATRHAERVARELGL